MQRKCSYLCHPRLSESNGEISKGQAGKLYSKEVPRVLTLLPRDSVTAPEGVSPANRRLQNLRGPLYDALHTTYYAPRPAERSKVGRGAFYFSAHSDLYQVTTGELFKVTMYTAHISSNGSHFLTGRVLVY